jgi:Flp pilus assembly protein TadB
LGTPSSLPPEERRALNLPEPVKPNDATLRALAQAGVSDPGLRAVSSRRTAKKVRADLESESRRRRAELKRVERRARALAVVKQGAPWLAIAFVIGIIVYLVGAPLLLSGGVAVGVLVLGPIPWHAFRRNQTKS